MSASTQNTPTNDNVVTRLALRPIRTQDDGNTAPSHITDRDQGAENSVARPEMRNGYKRIPLQPIDPNTGKPFIKRNTLRLGAARRASTIDFPEFFSRF